MSAWMEKLLYGSERRERGGEVWKIVFERHTFTSAPSLRRTMSKQTLAMESIVMPLCITSLEAKLAIKGNRHEASR